MTSYNLSRRAVLEDMTCDWPRGYVSALGVMVGVEYRTRSNEVLSAAEKRRNLAEVRGMRSALITFLGADPGLTPGVAEGIVRMHEKRYREALIEDIEEDARQA